MAFFRFTLFSIFLFVVNSSNAQSYSRVKVLLNEQHNITQLAHLGIAVDHGQFAAHRFYINDLSAREIATVRNNGFEVETIIADVVAYYQNPNRGIEFRDGDCFETTHNYPVPENFEPGSMAGFYTWEELLAILDDMQDKFPDLITMKTPIEGQTSLEGHPIYQLKISDNPNEVEEDEPEVLYTALHHAREPNSLTQMIYYMWYILEHYETDPNIQYLINNTAMYFIPCVNPDGYIYNQTTNPDGGGLWRKNRRILEGDTLGVDLNRNYGYRWGFDDTGSSPNPESQTYRGTLPFSEPETKAVRDFCNRHHFVATLNYHTYGNLLIYPWGYSDMPSADSSTFFTITEAMTLENNFLSGTGTTTVGYTVNGDSDDWMYGENESKPSILSMTPEVGTDGFWPAPGNIIPNCQNTLLMNLTLAEIPHAYAYINEISPKVFDQKMGFITYNLNRAGLADGDFNVKLIPLSENISSVGTDKIYSLDANESQLDSIAFLLEETTENGAAFSFILELSNDFQTWQDTINKQFLQLYPIFTEGDFNAGNWTNELSNSWEQSTLAFHSPNTSLKESTETLYPDNYDADIISPEITLPGSTIQTYVQFYAKWDIENDYDYAQVLLSVNGGAFTPLCGQYSSKGSSSQDFENPLYDGQQADWIYESINITDFANPGDVIRIKFKFHSDGYVNGQGIFVDDFRIAITSSTAIPTQNPGNSTFTLSQNAPNPAQNTTQIRVASQAGTFSERKLLVYNVLGEVIYEKELSNNPIETVKINTITWKSGIYFYHLQTDRLFSSWKKINISK